MTRALLFFLHHPDSGVFNVADEAKAKDKTLQAQQNIFRKV
jgi:hypothetical protein